MSDKIGRGFWLLNKAELDEKVASESVDPNWIYSTPEGCVIVIGDELVTIGNAGVPKIDCAVLRRIYEEYMTGQSIFLKWTPEGSNVQLSVTSADNITLSTVHYSVTIDQNKYKLIYSWLSTTSDSDKIIPSISPNDLENSVVKFIPQTLTESQKEQARINIGATNYVTTDTEQAIYGYKGFNAGFNVGADNNNSSGIELGNLHGVSTTPYIDFHTGSTIEPDFNARIIAENDSLGVLARNGFYINGQRATTYEEYVELDDKIKDLQLYKFPNAVIIGDPVINNGQVSGFSVDNYLIFPFILDVGDRNFQIDFSFTTGSDVTTQQNILDSKFGIALAIANGKGLMAVSSNGTNWTGTSVGTINIAPNTTYYARLTWNKLIYKTALSTNGTDYVDDMQIVMAQRPYPRTIYIGGGNAEELERTPNVFKGIINMNKASLSVGGAIIWQGMDDVGLATRADVSLSNLDNAGIQKIEDTVNNIIGDGLTIFIRGEDE